MAGDLHCHTKLSDGSAALEEIIMMAKRLKIDTIAVTDHDTQSGCSRAALIAKPYGIKVLHGLEISAYDYERKRNVHILCYEPEFPNRLEGLIKQTLDRRREAHKEAIAKVQKRFPINAEMVVRRSQGSTCIYKQHIMHAIIDSGCTDRMYGKAYELCFGKDGIAKTSIEYPDVFEVLELIHDSNGIAVLAHPYSYDSMELLPKLIEKGLDGIEVWHPTCSEEQIATLTEIANKHNLIKTGGSDFHGMYDSKVHTIGKCTTPDEEIDKILKKRKVKQAK